MADVVLTVNGYEADNIERRVAEMLLARLDEKIEAKIGEIITRRTEEIVSCVAADTVERAVEAVLAEGWCKTNSYGEPVGPKMMLKERISALLTEQVGDYNRRKTRVESIVEATIDTAMHAEFGKEIEAAKKQIKAALAEKVNNGFAEAVRSALGLRP